MNGERRFLSERSKVDTYSSCWLQITLQVATPLDIRLLNGQQLGLDGEHQYLNAGLAIALCYTWLQRTGQTEGIYFDQTVSSFM